MADGSLVSINRTARGVLDLWLASQPTNTRKAYAASVRDFARVLSIVEADREVDPGAAAELLLQHGRGAANARALAYRAVLQAGQLAPSTVNLRLAALRSLVEEARRLEVVDWSLEVVGLRSRTLRDTRGPGRVGVQRIIAAAAKSSTAARDVAILWCLYGLALRRGEVASLDRDDVDLVGGTLRVAGKGDNGEQQTLTLPPPILQALERWLLERPASDEVALFVNLAHGHQRARLTTEGIADVVDRHGKAAGLRVRPHQLRHSAITDALEQTRGDVRAVQQFSRHKDLRTLLRYDDNRRDLGGKVAALVAGAAALEES